MTIEPATPSDHEPIVEVWEASVRATHGFLKEEDILFFKPLILEQYLDAVDLWCARGGDGRIAGFLGVADGNIEMLFLHPEAIGQGLGRRLLEHAVHELGATRVDVNEQNEGACAFYEKLGFVVTGRSAVDGMGKPYPLLHMVLKEES